MPVEFQGSSTLPCACLCTVALTGRDKSGAQVPCSFWSLSQRCQQEMGCGAWALAGEDLIPVSSPDHSFIQGWLQLQCGWRRTMQLRGCWSDSEGPTTP